MINGQGLGIYRQLSVVVERRNGGENPDISESSVEIHMLEQSIFRASVA